MMLQQQSFHDRQRAASIFGPRWAQTSAAVGALVWLALLIVPSSDPYDLRIIKKLFLLGVLVIVPLGLSLVATPDRQGRHSVFYVAALLTQPAGAALVICSYLFEQGLMAALFASAWLVTTGLIALYGLVRFLPRGATRAEEVAIDAGLIYLAVGGGWFVLSRAGLQPLGFGDTIVLLTAVHFHYAGFAAPILAGMAGRMLPDRDAGAKRWSRNVCIAVIAAMPLVAAGITFSPALALAGAGLISLGLWLLAALVVRWVIPSLPPSRAGARILLAVSSASSSVAMVLACAYAYSIVAGRLIISIPQMAMFHGVSNALGFSLCGLIAWSFIRPEARTHAPGLPFSRLASRGFIGPNYFEQTGAIASNKAAPHGLVDDLEIYRRANFDTDAIHREVRAFYEQTDQYGLLVRPSWKRGFRLGGRIAHRLGAMIGQMRLPVATERLDDRIESRILPIEDSVDGREGVRAWVRTYEGTDKAMYTAAYATHSIQGNTYMNIAFPVPGGNVSSILHLSSLGEEQRAGRGIVLSTLPSVHAGGDQGVYFANPLLPIRLPINETITVWAADTKDAPFNIPVSMENSKVMARHEMWIFGIKFLELDYEIFQTERAGASPPS